LVTRHLFPEAERARIHAALETARAGTSAKLAFVVVPASERYALFPVAWAAVAAVVVTGALALARPDLGIGAGFAIDALVFVALSIVFDWWPLRLMLVPRHVKRFAAGRMAHREFAVNALSHDTAHNGVLIFVSLAERHIELIAERDAHAGVPAGTWEKIVADATDTARRDGEAAGIEAAIAQCGRALARTFPP
jgi:putative membrane protein